MKRVVRFFALFVAGVLLFPLLASAQSTPRPSCMMSATPSVIQKGATFNLRWQSVNATAGSITGLGAVPPQGIQGIIVTRPTLFTGTFWGAGGTTTCQASISFDIGGAFPTPAQQLPVGEIKTVGSIQQAGTIEAPTYTPTPSTLPSAPAVTQDSTPTTGLVPCKGIDCQFCHLAKLSQNVINFLVGLSIPIAAAMFAWAGALMFTAGDSSSRIDKAKSILRSVLIGFLIVLSAWLVVQTVLKAILNPAYYSGWNNIQCVAAASRPTQVSLATLIQNALGVVNTTPEQGLTTGTGVGVSTPGAAINRVSGCYEGAYLGGDGKCVDAFGSTYSPVSGAGFDALYGAPGTEQWKAQLQAACSTSGLQDCALARAIMENESSGNVAARSGVGAMGLMQVMPTTACQIDSSISGCGQCAGTTANNTTNACAAVAQAIREPSLNMALGTKYINQLNTMFNGDIEKVVAAYNAGPGANAPSKDCSSGTKWQCPVNPGGYVETQKYVPKVLATYRQLGR